MSTGVYVLGMHRSGTSATTRLIHLLGVPINVRSDWIEPAPDNPTGFWESQALVDLNDELLAMLGGDTEHPPDLPPGWETAPRLRELTARARALHPTLFTTEQWVWKDPRACLTFPFWDRAIGARPVIVLAYRNPLEVARSYAKRNELTIDHGLALWERYLIHSLRAARGLPTFVTAYDDMMRDPHAWCERVRDFLSRHDVTTAPGPDLAEQIDGFIDGSLRHSAHTVDDLRRHPEGARLVPLYSYLEAADGPHEALAPPVELEAETPATTGRLAHLPGRAELRVDEPEEVSVVVPVFDDGAGLPDTLRSLAEQSREPLEVIVVEGETALGAGARAEALTGCSALVLRAGPDRGAIRNTGVIVSRGEYVMTVESGDLLSPGFVEGAAARLREEHPISIVYADQRDIGDDTRLHTWHAYDLRELTRSNRIGAAAMFRRRAWEVTCGYASLDGYEEWDFWLHCGEAGYVGARLEGALVHHRVDPRACLSPARDRRLKARLVLNHPRLYPVDTLEWAIGVLSGEVTAPDGESAIGVVPPQRGVPPRWSGWRLPQLRSQALLVVAEEMLDEPDLAAPLRRIDPDADVTVVLAGAADETGALVGGLEPLLEASGLTGPLAPDIIAAPLSAGVLAQQADAILTLRTPPLPFSGLPRLDPETMVAWRAVAPAAV